MITPTEMKARLSQAFNDRQATVLTEVIHSSNRDLVHISDFSELKEIVRDLAAAQKRTEMRIEELAAAQQRTELRVEELAAAQQRTELRIEELAAAQQRTELRVEELAAAQQRTEMRIEELAAAQQRTELRVEELAAAQQRTELHIEELAAAQQRTEMRIEELAAAQQRTEEAVQGLDRSLQKLSRQVGGLSDRLGGDLEDVAYIVVHDVLAREYGWKVQPLARSWQKWNGAREEIDLFGQVHDPMRPDLPIWIVGEVKFNLTVKEVERFTRKVAKARQHIEGEVFPLCFCYRARPEVQQAVQAAGMRLVFSYGRMI